MAPPMATEPVKASPTNIIETNPTNVQTIDFTKVRARVSICFLSLPLQRVTFA